jgi:hypothetical protein
MKKILLLLLLLPGIAGMGSQMKKQQWNKLGDVSVTSRLDNESIMVTGSEKFRSVKLKALNSAIQISSVDIYYESGEVQNVSSKITMDNGKESEPIPLKNGQVLKKIVFSYKLFAGKENAEVLVELYGMK